MYGVRNRTNVICLYNLLPVSLRIAERSRNKSKVTKHASVSVALRLIQAHVVHNFTKGFTVFELCI